MNVSEIKRKCAHYLTGIGVSPGISISKAFTRTSEKVEVDSSLIDKDHIDDEIQKLNAALSKAKTELRRLQNKAARRIGESNARIFDVHQLLLDDNTVISEVEACIRNELRTADWAYFHAMQKYQESLGQSRQEFFQSRVADLKDVQQRVIRHIQGDRTDFLNRLKGNAVIIAAELTPSEAVKLDKHKAVGFAIDTGGRTSHVALIARSLEVPAVVGLRKLTRLVSGDERIIIDGTEGVVIIEPDDDVINHYRKLQQKQNELEEKLTEVRDLPCVTLDGKEIELSANLEFADEIESVKSHGARGVGLYRTDYLYLAGEQLPSEEEQFKEYKNIVEKMAPETVIIRTMDIGGDKQPRSLEIPAEENPFLGWRAIRISLERKDIFSEQLKAILRASKFGNVRILFPMISGLGEVHECKSALEQAKELLRQEGHAFDEEIETGVMIEVPSAAILAYQIAKEVDFLSIGTNDLVQYSLAVDRGNERISYLYQHLHPAILRLIQSTIQDGHRAGVWVGMCGDMASDPLSALLLLGLDLDEFSVSPHVLPEIKKILRSTEHREAVKIAQKALEFDKASEVEGYLVRIMHQKFKDLGF